MRARRLCLAALALPLLAAVGCGGVSISGASEATVLIVPIDDHVLLEADELVVLTLSVDAAYDIGLVNSGVVTILDPL